jgi:glycosyltransferase involved in cell wall biosynthesis
MLISIVIPTFNGVHYLEKQVESIIHSCSQADISYELLIGDDGSNDGTIDTIKYLQNKFNCIRLLQNNCRNINKNINILINEARGKIIFFSDQDDFWFENCVNEHLNKHKEYDAVFHQVIFVDKNSLSLPITPKTRKINFLTNFYQNTVIGSTVSINRRVIQIVHPFPINIPHDHFLALFLSLRSIKSFYLKNPLSAHRLHDTNSSFTGMSSQRALLVRFFERLLLLLHFCWRLTFCRP